MQRPGRKVPLGLWGASLVLLMGMWGDLPKAMLLYHQAMFGVVPACYGVPAAFLSEVGMEANGHKVFGHTELLNWLWGDLWSGGAGVWICALCELVWGCLLLGCSWIIWTCVLYSSNVLMPFSFNLVSRSLDFSLSQKTFHLSLMVHGSHSFGFGFWPVGAIQGTVAIDGAFLMPLSFPCSVSPCRALKPKQK